ncbi:MarR family winged helix-turn-helix transcriptional regulator [Actinomycetospora termitidis]|uniref:MarR family winged helix-turn-helix transcriptional regulator n=1 Tax=Actinomycetospora termitidis TaxID=3053470 RepID=A0ABT7MF74_9PSEU|nr:MarR family winged helix-turn-helix transcriptional regulator [Actinomycetospora sp. Odt1-22]MDL5158537.1 MarR family winged helix-turn-helix transcriptional regulator [Actinomycetospora sp. Odt1-22]
MSTPRQVESDLGWALGRVARAHLRTAQTVMGGLPGGPRGYQVLAAVARGEPASQLALARKLGVDRTVMTYLLDEIQAAGLIERRPDPADRRARRVEITEAGGARLCDLERRLRDAEEHLLAPLRPEEQDVLRELLARLAAVDPDQASACQVAADLTACEET